MSWFPFLLISTLLVLWLRWRHKNRKILEIGRVFPGPPPVPILGNALDFSCGPVGLVSVLKDLRDKYGDVIRLWFGLELNVIVNDPDDLKTLLSSPKTNYKGPQYKFMADLLGGGILSGSGPKWRKHRKLATPNYGKRAIDSYSDKINEEIGIMLDALTHEEMGVMLNIYKRVVKCTSYIVCQTLLGVNREDMFKLPYLQEVIDEAPSLYVLIFNRMTKWYLQLYPVYWVLGYRSKQKNFIKRMNALCSQIVNHSVDKLKRMDLTADLLNADEDSSKNAELSVVDRFVLSEMDSGELFTETFTIFTSSQEATAKIASLALLMLAYHPDCQEKLYKELKAVTGDEDRWITDEDFKRMPYLDMVFREVIRLFPIGAMLQRTIGEDIEISSGTLPAGCSLVIPIYHMHRDPRFWKDPEAFDPERFSPENTKMRHPNCYIPFSLGPMDCLGRYFAIKMVKTICARVVKKFELSSKEKYADLQLSIAISTFPVKGFPLMLKLRNK